MGDIVDTLFGGGGGKKATKQQRKENARTREFIEQQQAQARGDALGLFSAGAQDRRLGTQAAFDVLGQTIPQQFDTFQQGNVGAQQALLAGLPQFQNAILGLPTDMSALQPQAIPFDVSFAQQQVPEFTSSSGLLGGVPTTTAPGSSPVPGTPGEGTASEGRNVPGYGGEFDAPAGSVPYLGGGGGVTNPFGDTYNGSAVDQIFGRQDIGSLAQLGLSEQGGMIGRLAGALTGIPGLGSLGRYIGNRNIDNKTWMNPVNPNNPYDSLSDTSQGIADIMQNPEGLPRSTLGQGATTPGYQFGGQTGLGAGSVGYAPEIGGEGGRYALDPGRSFMGGVPATSGPRGWNSSIFGRGGRVTRIKT